MLGWRLHFLKKIFLSILCAPLIITQVKEFCLFILPGFFIAFTEIQIAQMALL